MGGAKTAGPIEMQFGMLTRVGPGNIVLHGDVDASTAWGTFGVFGRLKGII